MYPCERISSVNTIGSRQISSHVYCVQGTGPQVTGINYALQFVEVSVEWRRDEMIWYIEGQEVAHQTLLRNFWSGVGENPYTDIR